MTDSRGEEPEDAPAAAPGVEEEEKGKKPTGAVIDNGVRIREREGKVPCPKGAG